MQHLVAPGQRIWPGAGREVEGRLEAVGVVVVGRGAVVGRGRGIGALRPTEEVLDLGHQGVEFTASGDVDGLQEQLLLQGRVGHGHLRADAGVPVRGLAGERAHHCGQQIRLLSGQHLASRQGTALVDDALHDVERALTALAELRTGSGDGLLVGRRQIERTGSGGLLSPVDDDPQLLRADEIEVIEGTGDQDGLRGVVGDLVEIDGGHQLSGFEHEYAPEWTGGALAAPLFFLRLYKKVDEESHHEMVSAE